MACNCSLMDADGWERLQQDQWSVFSLHHLLTSHSLPAAYRIQLIPHGGEGWRKTCLTHWNVINRDLNYGTMFSRWVLNETLETNEQMIDWRSDAALIDMTLCHIEAAAAALLAAVTGKPVSHQYCCCNACMCVVNRVGVSYPWPLALKPRSQLR